VAVAAVPIAVAAVAAVEPAVEAAVMPTVEAAVAAAVAATVAATMAAAAAVAAVPGLGNRPRPQQEQAAYKRQTVFHDKGPRCERNRTSTGLFQADQCRRSEVNENHVVSLTWAGPPRGRPWPRGADQT